MSTLPARRPPSITTRSSGVSNTEAFVTPPTVYNYNATTGLYLGSSQAQQSPLDVPGTWLYPANTTLIAPPTAGPGQAAYFSAKFGSWGLSSAKPAPPGPPPGVPSCL